MSPLLSPFVSFDFPSQYEERRVRQREERVAEQRRREAAQQAVRQQRIQEAERIYSQILADRAQSQQESDDDVLQVQEDHPIG